MHEGAEPPTFKISAHPGSFCSTPGLHIRHRFKFWSRQYEKYCLHGSRSDGRDKIDNHDSEGDTMSLNPQKIFNWKYLG